MKKRKSHERQQKFTSNKFLQMIGVRLKEQRLSNGLTLSAAAKHLKVSANFLQQVKKGQLDFRLDFLFEICTLYGVNIRDIVSIDFPH